MADDHVIGTMSQPVADGVNSSEPPINFLTITRQKVNWFHQCGVLNDVSSLSALAGSFM